jgi:hypothetical protein
MMGDVMIDIIRVAKSKAILSIPEWMSRFRGGGSDSRELLKAVISLNFAPNLAAVE